MQIVFVANEMKKEAMDRGDTHSVGNIRQSIVLILELSQHLSGGLSQRVLRVVLLIQKGIEHLQLSFAARKVVA